MVGVDIGCKSIKLLALSRSKRGWHVRSAAVLTRTVAADPAFEASVQQSVRAALRSLPRRERRIAVAAPATGVFSRTLPIPPVLSTRETELWMEQEAGRHLPFPVAELYFDWYRKSGAQTMTLLACHRAGLESRLAMLQKFGSTKVADVDALALHRVICALTASVRPGARLSSIPHTAVVLDMGASGLRLHILGDGDLQYSNEQPSLPIEAGHTAATRQVLVMRAVHLLQLAQAVTPNVFTSPIVLTGGYAAVPGLGESLSELTGLTVSVADVTKNLGAGGCADKCDLPCKLIVGRNVDAHWLQRHGSLLTLAFGLAMSEAA